jgi:carbon-monoxide dehydrogenase medium subunit
MNVSFSYHTPKTVIDTVKLLSEHGASSRLLAGGQTLIPELRKRLNEKHAIIDLGHVTELDYIRIDDCAIFIGAMCHYVTAAELPELRKQAPHLAQVFASLGSRALRNIR